jgi:hypothetical protein
MYTIEILHVWFRILPSTFIALFCNFLYLFLIATTFKEESIVYVNVM